MNQERKLLFLKKEEEERWGEMRRKRENERVKKNGPPRTVRKKGVPVSAW
jgi:hypothetical protein